MFCYFTRIYLRHTDAAKVLYFSNIFDLAHEAFEAYLVKNKSPLVNLLDQEEVMFPIVHANANYLKPIILSDLITIKLSLKEKGKTSFTLSYNCLRENTLVANVEIVHVLINKNKELIILQEHNLLSLLDKLQMVPH